MAALCERRGRKTPPIFFMGGRGRGMWQYFAAEPFRAPTTGLAADNGPVIMFSGRKNALAPQFAGAIKNCHNNVPSRSTRDTSKSLLTNLEPILMATALPIQFPATKQTPIMIASGQ